MSILTQIISGWPGLFYALMLWMVFHNVGIISHKFLRPALCYLFLRQRKSNYFKSLSIIQKEQVLNIPSGSRLSSLILSSVILPENKSNRSEFYALFSGSVKKLGLLFGIFFIATIAQLQAATITSTGTGGDWSSGSTWVGGIVPAGGDDVVIASGTPVQINGPVSCNNLTINSACILTVNGTNTLTITGNWQNNGTFNASNGTVVFSGNTDTSFEGTSATTFYDLTIAKTNGLDDVIDFNSSGVVTCSHNLTMTNGLLKFSSGSINLDCNSAFTIERPSGIWVAGAMLNTGAFSITNKGLIRVSAGTASFGNSSGNSVHTQFDGAFEVTGGNVFVAGRLENSAGGTLAPGIPSGITVSGGNISLGTVGNGASSSGTLDVSTNGAFNFTGGTIIFQNASTASTPMDVALVLGSGSGAKNTTGGTFQLGNGSTPANSLFRIDSGIPIYNLTITTNASVLVVGNDLTISNQLKMQGGNIDVATNGKEVILTNPDINSLTRTSGFVNGQMTRAIGNATGTTYLYPVGNSTNYTPLLLNFAGANNGGSISVTSLTGEHSNIGSSLLNNAKSVNNYWQFENSGVTFTSLSGDFTFPDALAEDGSYKVGIYNGSSWIYPSASASTLTTAGFSGLTSLSGSYSFAIAECVKPTITLNAVLPVCSGTTSVQLPYSGTTGSPTEYRIDYDATANAAGLADVVTNLLPASPITLSVPAGISPATYNGMIYVSNAVDCESDGVAFQINVNPLPTATISGGTTVCQNDASPLITFTGANGTAPFTFTYKINGGGNQTVTTISGSSVTVAVPTVTFGTFIYSLVSVQESGSLACSQSQTGTATVVVNQLPTATATPSAQTICSGTAPSIALSSTVAGTTFSWTVVQSGVSGATAGSGATIAQTLSATGVVSGTATYTVTPVANGCTGSSITVVITVNPAPSVTATPAAQTICSGDATSILLSSTTAGTTFSWTIADLPVGSISGASAGSGTSIVQTLINTTPLQATLTYTITPRANGCDGIPINVVITVKPKPVLTSSLTPAQSCSNTLFNYVPTSDTPGTTFAWSRATILGITPVGTTGTGAINETLTNITAGIINVTYVFTLTANGCTNTQNVVVAVLPALTLSSSLSPPAVCSTTPFTYTPTTAISGVTLTWSRAVIAGISNPAASGTGAINETLINTTTNSIVVPYVFTLSAGTCTNTQTVNVTVRPMPELTSTLAPAAICNNTAFNYTATSNVTLSSIQWSRAVVPGISNGAGFGATNTINETLINTTADPIVVTYAFILRAAGCQNNQNVTVTVNPTPKLTGTLTPAAICSNSVFSYTPASLTAGTTFSWTRAAVAGISNAAASGAGNPNETLINTTTNPISVTYVYTLSANGCSNTQNVVVVVNPLPTVIATTINATICEGSGTTLTASGASTYSWSPATGLSSTTGASVTANPVVTTTYTVTGTDANGCLNTASVTITVLPRPNVTVTASSSTICNGGSSTLTASGAISYSWSPATGLSATTGSSVTANPTVTTTYTVTGTAANGCTNIASVTITVNAPFTVTATASPAVICEGNSSTLTASGAVSYVWSPDTDLSSPTGSSVTATPSTTTTYTVVGTDANGCTNSTTVTVTVNPMPVLTNPNPSPATICGGTAFNYAPTSSVSGTNFSWTRNTPAGITSSAPTSGTGNISNHILTNTTASPIPVTYTYTLTANGCTNPITYAVVIVVIPAPTVTALANGATSLTVCEGTSVNLTSNSSLVFQDPNLTPATGFSGWTTSRGNSPSPSGGTVADADWTLRSDGYSYGGTTFDSPDGQFYLSNARDQGGNGDTHTILRFGPINPTGYTTLSLNFYHYYRDGGGGAGDNAYVEVSTDGTNWGLPVTTFSSPQGAANAFVNLATPINLSAYIINPTLYIRFRYRATNPSNAYYWAIGRVNLTGTSADNPVISWTSSPAGFTSSVANPPTAVSPTVTTTYTVTYTDPTADPNTLCPGSNSVTVTVRPEPTMTSSNTVAICSGSNVNLPLTADIPSTYTWVAASNGNVGGESTTTQSSSTISNTLTLNGGVTTAQTVTYTVTPTTTTGSCVGTPQPVTVIVNPIPSVNQPGNQTLCSGVNTTAINFVGSGVTPTSSITYEWINDNPSIGLDASGTGNIPAFTATNTGTTPAVANITVTPTFTNAGTTCSGTPRTFTITVNPVPVATIEANYCPDPPNDKKIELTAETGPGTYTYNWSTGEHTKTIYVDIADSYSVDVINSYGCQTTAFLPVSNDLVVNGDFTNWNLGDFVTGYTYHADVPGLVPTGQGELYNDSGTNGYSVVTNGQNVHVNFWGIDHTNNSAGSRRFMIVNGHGNITIWQQTVNITPNTDYYFSAYAMSVNAVGPYARLQFEVNGTPVGTVANLTAGPNTIAQANANNYWTRFYSNPKWNSGALSGPITIRIINLENALGGNDFALDDISFGTLDPVPGDINPSVNGLVCQYGNLNLLANKTSIKPPFTYAWTGPNGFTSTEENPVITNISSANSGRYKLSFTDGYGCETDTGSVVVTVNATPVCSISSSSATFPNTIPNATDTYTAPAGMATYAWSVTGNGTIVGSATGQTVNVKAGAACTGSYTVSVIITESSGCSSNCSQVVSLNDTSVPVVTGAFSLQTINGCSVADAPAATTVAQLEALPGNVVITDAFTPKALLTVTHSDVVTGTCPITITRIYTVTDACSNSVSITQNINVQDVISPGITGSLSPVTVSGCSAANAPPAVTTVAALEALAGGVGISDNCTPDASLTVSSSDVSSGTCIVTITRTYTIKDACNNPATLVQTITVQDNVAPTWTTLANALDVTVQCGDAVGLASAQSLAPVATDLCSTLSAPVKTSGAFVAGGICPQIGTYTNTWVVTDACGNTSAVYTQIITIEDTTAPVWTTPLGSLNVFLECDDAGGIASAQAMIPVATDNCGGSYSAVKTSGAFVASGACLQAGTYTNTFVVTDNCGNVSVPFTQIITLEDNTAPDIIAPAVAVISCLDDPNNLTLTGSPTVTDNCDAATIITHSDTSVPTTCGGDYKITRTWTATDHCGNSNSAVQEIFVQDIEAPVISALPAPFTIDCDDAPNFTTPTAIDACASTFTLTSADVTTPGTCANSYSITRTWTAKDACGNTSTASQTINVQDIVVPTINCPTAVNAIAGTAECGASGIALGTPTVADNCSTLAQITITNDAPALFPIGVTTVTWTATDACGNFSTCTQTVTVTDNSLPPTISCPANVSETVSASSCSKTNVVVGVPTYSDNCPNPALTYVLSGATTGSGNGIVPVAQVYNVGITTVTYTVTDGSGNTASCSFTVTILRLDIPPAVVTCPANPAPVTAPSGSCTAAVTVDSPVINDPCATATYTVVNSFNGTANASGNYPAGTTTVTWTITDNSGNTTTCTQTVTVTAAPPTITCPPNRTVNCSDLMTPAALGTATGTDPCDPSPVISYADVITPGACSGNYTISRTWTASNSYGISISCVQTITVVQPDFAAIAPTSGTADCVANIVLPALPVVTDACGTVLTPTGPVASADPACNGPKTYTWTYTDCAGNTQDYVHTVTVNDIIKPIITCPSDQILPADWNQSFATVSLVAPTYSDNCTATANLLVTWTMTGATTDSGTGIIPVPYKFNAGVTTVTYKVVDECGNYSECQFIITILAKPEITCLPAIIKDSDIGLCTAKIDPGIPTLDTGAQPINWIWTILEPDGVTIGASGSSKTPDDGLTPLPIGLYDFKEGTSIITWHAENSSGSDECTQQITVVDHEPPVFVLPAPLSECVSTLQEATFYAPTNDITPNRPEYYVLVSGDIALDLDISKITDNCSTTCSAPEFIEIRWRIEMNDGTSLPSSPAPAYQTGQPSTYGSNIPFMGDGLTFTNVVHTITYWIVDCKGNVSAPQSQSITIKPRPNIIKGN